MEPRPENSDEILDPRLAAIDSDLLVVSGAEVVYGKQTAVYEASLRIGQGEVVLLTGHTGAGKSSLVEAIVGLVPLRAGEIAFLGQSVADVDTASIRDRGLAIIPQGAGFLRRLSVEENLRCSLAVMGHLSSRPLDWAFDRFPTLYERRKQQAGTLSGGEQRLLAVAIALSAEPRLLIVDEAVLGLSHGKASMILDVLAEVSREDGPDACSMLLVDQQVGRLIDYVDRYYVLRQGRMVSSGDREELVAVGDIRVLT